MRVTLRCHYSRVREPTHELLHCFPRDHPLHARVWPLRPDVSQQALPLDLRHEQGSIPLRRQAESQEMQLPAQLHLVRRYAPPRLLEGRPYYRQVNLRA